MSIILSFCIIALLLFFGLIMIWEANQSPSLAGRKTLAKLSKGQRKQRVLWSVFPLRQLVGGVSQLIYLDEIAETRLRRDLEKAGIQISPQEYTARKTLIIIGGILGITLCATIGFYFGILIAALGLVFGLFKQRDMINAGIRKTETAITQEMPRFVKTICRSLQSDRDLQNVIVAYRKVAGPVLGAQLDILLAEMHSGNMQSSLLNFEARIGTSEISRLCGALRDMSMGIDQTATLSYLADDMAKQAKENVKRELSLRPEKMRRTYYPAIGVCVAMILYVLVVYIINNLNNFT